MDDLISRQSAINAGKELCETCYEQPNGWCGSCRMNECLKAIEELPPAESSIPISWIEKYIDWLGGMKCGASEIIAFHVSLMVQRWSKKFLS